MGGTTAKSCLIQDGVAGVVPTFEVGRVQRFQKGSGLTIQVPVVDLMEIGAGGGSIARASRLGTLQVGPESAGAEPGPICYGRGGTEPTVTDADLLLGYLDPDYFLGGTMHLDAAAARRGIEERSRRPLGVSFIQAVWGIHDLINETMAAAAKTHIAERGGNPQLVTIAAFGGAGPVHAYGLARKLGAPRLVVPPNAGVGSALGFFTAPRAFDLVRSHKVPFATADFAKLEGLFRELEVEGERTLRKAGAEGQVHFARSVEARFIGQGSETSLPVPEARFRRARSGRRCAGASTPSTSGCTAAPIRSRRSSSSTSACARACRCSCCSCRRSPRTGRSPAAPQGRTRRLVRRRARLRPARRLRSLPAATGCRNPGPGDLRRARVDGHRRRRRPRARGRVRIPVGHPAGGARRCRRRLTRSRWRSSGGA